MGAEKDHVGKEHLGGEKWQVPVDHHLAGSALQKLDSPHDTTIRRP